MFAKGVNWIPDDHFVTRITAEQLDRRLDQAVQANVNLVRVWGGGIYESEDFYSACDERGMLVWQDFLLACAAYPGGVAALGGDRGRGAGERRPALILTRRWCCSTVATKTCGGMRAGAGRIGWMAGPGVPGTRTSCSPAIVAELDPTRPYSENSPSSPGFDLSQVHPNDPDHGSHHQWEVWNQIDYSAYRKRDSPVLLRVRLPGPAGLADPDRLGPRCRRRSAERGDRSEERPELSRAPEGGGRQRKAGPRPGTRTWAYRTTSPTGTGQRNSIRPGRSATRSTTTAGGGRVRPAPSSGSSTTAGRSPRGQPSTPWVDAKPLWYALRRAFAPRNLVFAHRRRAAVGGVLNDTDQPWRGEIALTRQRFDGEALAQDSLPVDLGPRSSTPLMVPAEVASAADPRAEVVTAELDGYTAAHTFAEDLDLDLDPDPLQVAVDRVADGYTVTVTARAFARDVTLHPDRVAADATVDEALVTLRAGEQATFQVRTQSSGLEQALAGYPVVRTANDLQRR